MVYSRLTFSSLYLGRGKRLLRVSPLRVRRLPGEVVRQAVQDGLSGHHDVPPVAADARVDREGHRVATERGLHLAEPLQGVVGPLAGAVQPEHVDQSSIMSMGRRSPRGVGLVGSNKRKTACALQPPMLMGGTCSPGPAAHTDANRCISLSISLYLSLWV